MVGFIPRQVSFLVFFLLHTIRNLFFIVPVLVALSKTSRSLTVPLHDHTYTYLHLPTQMHFVSVGLLICIL
jgi:hypothetical protein